jgi:hypothetical protein
LNPNLQKSKIKIKINSIYLIEIEQTNWKTQTTKIQQNCSHMKIIPTITFMQLSRI